jgi:hypothetical protein
MTPRATPTLDADLEAGLRRLRLGAIRRNAADILATARTQRWAPDDANAAGINQLRAILEPLEAMVVAVPLTKVLHLKSAVTALPDGSIIGYAPLVDDPQFFSRFVPVPKESGAHVVLLGGGKLLMAADCPRSTDLLAELGYAPVTVDISEFEKLEGCVTCLSVRIRGMRRRGSRCPCGGGGIRWVIHVTRHPHSTEHDRALPIASSCGRRDR